MNFVLGLFILFPAWAFAWVGNGLTPATITFKSKLRFDPTQTEIDQIDRQLKYLFGNLNEQGIGNDFPKRKILTAQLNDGILTYTASIPTLYPENGSPMEFILPVETSTSFLMAWTTKYQANCARKASSLETFWNYIMPHKVGCRWDEKDIVRAYPEIKKDQESSQENIEWSLSSKVNIVALFTYENEIPREHDGGLEDFNVYYNYLKQQEIISEKKEIVQLSDIEITITRLSIRTASKIIETTLLLTPNLNKSTKGQLNSIATFTKNADYISFNGHSGMGKNIESLEQGLELSSSKKQIVFFNSCDTYGYFSGELISRFSASPKLIILNTLPNYFMTMGESNAKLTDLFLNSNFYINEILEQLPENQGSVAQIFDK